MLYIQSIIVYTLLALLMCYGAYRSQGYSRSAKLWGWVPIILFTLVFGLRYGVGVDYNNYLEIYEETEYYETFSQILDNERYEPGFSLLLYICHYCNAPVYILFSAMAFLEIFLLYKAFKEEGDILIYIYATLIFTTIGISSFMNILRHIVAFCFFIYSIQYIRDNKLIRYWICCLLALVFHKSAIILFPLYFVWIKRKGFFKQPLTELIVVLVCFALSVVPHWQEVMHMFDNLIILMGYENYIDIADQMIVNSKMGITRLFTLAATIVIILNSNRIKDYFQSDLLNILYDMYIIGISLGYIFMGSMLLERIIVYFTHTQFIIIAYALCYFYKTRKQSISQLTKYAFVVLFIFVVYSAYIFNSLHNTGAYVFYFQTELHDIKDSLREDMINNLK